MNINDIYRRVLLAWVPRGANIVWPELAYGTGNSISGFTAGAYQNTQINEIVIAFKGTDFSSSSKIQTAADIAADLAMDGIPLINFVIEYDPDEVANGMDWRMVA
jgi:hypothetical protein